MEALPSLPPFMQLDASGAASLQQLQWQVEASRVEVSPRKEEPAVVAPPTYPREVEYEIVSELHRLLSVEARGVAEAAHIQRTRRRRRSEEEGSKSRYGPWLRCVNDHESKSLNLYASQNTLTRALSYATVGPRGTHTICLSTGQMRQNDEADVLVVIGARLVRDDVVAIASEGTASEEPTTTTTTTTEVVTVDFDIGKPLGMQLEYEASRDRIVVHSVQTGYQAARDDRIRAGLLVAAVNGAPVRNLDDFGATLQRLRRAGDGLALTFRGAAQQQTWRFETEGEERLAERVPPSHQPAAAFVVGLGETRSFRVRVRNCTVLGTLRVYCGDELRRSLVPGGLFREDLRTTRRLDLVLEEGDCLDDAPALSLQCGSAGVEDLYGYSLVWQARVRTLSIVASHVAETTTKPLEVTATTSAARARLEALRVFRTMRASAAVDHNAPAFQLTVV